jgi:NAD(P)-dependent dehydrogenase (short-subunit alcohol dehydrogenase family)
MAAFEGKRALITGGSRGIGLAVAERLLTKGAIVTIASRVPSKSPAVAELAAQFPSILLVDVDLEDVTACRDFAAAMANTDLDILINNAGIYHTTDSVTFDPNRIFQVNCFAPTQLIMDLIDPLSRNKGVVINISSVNATVPNLGAMEYSMTKAALDIASRCLARQLAPKGVRVCAVAPGPTDTDLLHGALAGNDPSFLLSHIPLGRLGLADDIAAAVVWLASEEASWITGQVLVVDGGLSC